MVRKGYAFYKFAITLCIVGKFPKFQTPDEIFKYCTVSYYSRINGAKDADRNATLVQSNQCSKVIWFVCTKFAHILLFKNLGFGKLQHFSYVHVKYTELMQHHTMVAEIKDYAFKWTTCIQASVLLPQDTQYTTGHPKTHKNIPRYLYLINFTIFKITHELIKIVAINIYWLINLE